eukprot:TRINITY_DN61401_c0_g1_i1.p1 TRINITY_DN61401_c0_g1~~TRINITY_DN61401_c0_g1_i1.p1  ORF type:complete len:368 (+),score=109.31 TRINITY_DN61401_c0_g1_i1:67-1104(+)
MGCCLSRFGLRWARDVADSPHAAALLGSPRGSARVGGMQLDKVKSIGEGGFGYVWLCRDAGPPERAVALKSTSVDPDEGEHVRQVVTEAHLLSSLRHPCIVGYIAHEVRDRGSGSGQRRTEVLLALEFCPGSLRDEMAAQLQSQSALPPQRYLKALSDVVSAVAYLHEQKPPIAHRDLKVENVLVAGDGRCRLCDFGSATTEAREPRSKLDIATAEEEISRNTTLQYRAPEQIDLWQKRRIDERVDCWALGVMLFYLAFMELPFAEQPLQITNCSYRAPPHSEQQCPPAVLDMVRRLLVPDPAERPDIWGLSELLCAAAPDGCSFPALPRPDPVPRQDNICPPAG